MENAHGIVLNVRGGWTQDGCSRPHATITHYWGKLTAAATAAAVEVTVAASAEWRALRSQ